MPAGMTNELIVDALMLNAGSGDTLTQEQAAQNIADAIIATIKNANIILAPTTGLVAGSNPVTGEMIYTIE